MGKMQKKLFSLVFLMSAFILFLAGCGSDSGSDAKVINYGRRSPSMTVMDAQVSTTSDVIQVARLVTEPLLTYDEDKNLIPLLLESLPETEDNKKFTLHLKKDVKFHDGSDFTAEDVVFTFNRMYDPATKSTNTFIADMIKGATEKLEGKADTIEGVRAIDDHTVEIELNEPFAPFPTVLASEMLVMYPKAAVEAAGDQWGVSEFVGTGPFKYEEFVPGDKFVGKKNEDYHGDEIQVDEINVFNMDENTLSLEYEAGNINYAFISNKMANNYEDSDFADDLEKQEVMGIVELVFNSSIEPTNDVNVRKAIEASIDKEGIVNSFLQGKATPATSAIPQNLIGHTERPLHGKEVEKAKEYLKAAGYENGLDVETYVIEGSELADVAIVLQEQLKESGINLKVNQVDQGTYTDLRNQGKIQLVLRNWYKDFPDPDNFLYTFFHSAAQPNRAPDWGKPETDKLLDEARKLPQEEREPVYAQVDKILVEDEVAAVPLYYPEFYFLKNKGISGAVSNDGLLDFTHIKIADK